jgi:hypothetical protein
MDRKRSVFTLRNRSFLNSVSTGHTSYILAEVESSQNGGYKWGHYMLTLADCRRRIQLEFFIGTLRARRESLRKIDLLIKRLEQFRTSLQREVSLIEQYEATQKSKPRKLKKEKGSQSKSRG